ncbi:alkaline phosphatase D family protein [Urechidicola vernalis]|uniref:Alkaline phosphatase D family protein n=1 Tax=Urechidicola vernalis TaxID=3075600 RepID=A0ABU2Y7M9_9FLAO|nr:alkaline phosphatase D family protein [Urechidicola sp. P050]MDT0554037.1 alkaline phosphatase D family protein [Urechidicola sp. P050]
MNRCVFNKSKFWYLIFVLILVSCDTLRETNGPFFGNGIHNGWADQNSIVIWTRLTKNAERNTKGTPFIAMKREKLNQYDAEGFDDEIYAAQMPEGKTLENMLDACPGTSGEVKLTYFPLGNEEDKIATDWVAVANDKNFTTQWKLENLRPGTNYAVQIEARKDENSAISDTVTGAFKTAPETESTDDINFSIVTCHDYLRKDDPDGHLIYKALEDLNPDFYVHTGDIEYYDKMQPYAMTEELMRFKWDRLFGLPLQREFWSNHTTYYMKDDHDILRNDAYPGMHYGSVTFERGQEIFDKEQFPTHDKFYKTIRWSKDVQVWITESRNYRSQNDMPDGPGKTIFGAEQKAWLFKTLQESDATFKIIINANPILGPDRIKKYDSYANKAFKTEADEIRSFLNEFDNVYLVNGDRHWQYVTHLEGTNLWEFGCGAGSDKHASGWNPNDKRPEHKFLRVKGGFLQGNVSRTEGNPTLKLQLMDVGGNVVFEKKFVK